MLHIWVVEFCDICDVYFHVSRIFVCWPCLYIYIYIHVNIYTHNMKSVKTTSLEKGVSPGWFPNRNGCMVKSSGGFHGFTSRMPLPSHVNTTLITWFFRITELRTQPQIKSQRQQLFRRSFYICSGGWRSKSSSYFDVNSFNARPGSPVFWNNFTFQERNPQRDILNCIQSVVRPDQAKEYNQGSNLHLEGHTCLYKPDHDIKDVIEGYVDVFSWHNPGGPVKFPFCQFS